MALVAFKKGEVFMEFEDVAWLEVKTVADGDGDGDLTVGRVGGRGFR